jgi:ADP-heptose:LPS heptosyltransferase
MLYKHHVLFEVVTNADEHADQPHPVDAMLTRIGLDPAQIDAELKVVRPGFTDGEIAQAQAEVAGRKLGIYQMSAAGKIRSFGPDQSIANLTELAKAFPDMHWIALFDTFVDNSYRMKAEACGCDNVRPMFFQNLRELWALTSQAALVVSPDSMMVHVAGCMNIPCVGLWGSTDPRVRVKYYKNHVALWKHEACPAAPCFQHHSLFPEYCPTRAQEQCGVLYSIAPEEIVNAARTLLG